MLLQMKKTIQTPTRIMYMLVLAKLVSPLPLEDEYGDSFMWIFKCCEENFIFGQSECIFNDTVDITLPVYREDHVSKDISMKVNFIYYNMECIPADEGSLLFVSQFSASASENFFLQNDGRLWVPKVNVSFSNRQFCVDHFSGFGISAVICFRGLQPIIDKVSGGISLIGMLVSLPFLLMTFVVHVLLPERNLYGKCLMSYVFSLFWAYSLPVFYFIYGQFAVLKLLACRILVVTYTFFFICSFFWMNVIAFDIWQTFSGCRGVLKNEEKRFFKYSIYAWGMPALLIIVLIVLSITVSPSAWYSPFGEGCYLQEGLPHLLYLYGPMGILIIINVGLFVATAWAIMKTHRETALLRERGNVTHNSENEATLRFKVYLKLMFAMGINWSVEFIGWAVTWQVGPLPFLWYVMDICNAGLGVFIFFLFVFNKTSWKMLKIRYNMAKEQTDPTQTQMTSSP